MRRSPASWLTWSLAGVSLAMFAAGVAFAFLTLNVANPVVLTSSDWGVAGAIGGILLFLPFLAFPIVGALIASKRSRNPIGWICLIVGLFWMFIVLGDRSTAYSLARSGSVGGGPVMLDAVAQSIWVPPLGLLGTFLVMLFPDGRLPSPRWRPLVWISGTAILAASVALDLTPGPLPHRGGVRNPLGIEHPRIQIVEAACLLLLALRILASAVSLIWHYRRSDAEVRQQIKWLAFAASFVGMAYLGILVGGLFFADYFSAGGKTPLWLSLLQNVLLLGYAGIPAAIGFAVLKYRLYDIDIIINRALVYGSLTLTLALIYFGGVVGTQAVFRTLTGQEQPQLAVVVSTLAIAALFNPLRRRIQSFIDRRFYAESTMPQGSSKPSRPGCVRRRTSTGWEGSWSRWSTRPCGPSTPRCG
jgi:hypothetical protein